MTKTTRIGGGGPPVLLAVRVGEGLYAIPIEAVEEVFPALPVETIPQAPAFVRGVVFVRGHLIPVLRAAERLGIAPDPHVVEPHVVCLRVEERLVGVEVDEAVDLMELPLEGLLPATEFGAESGFFTGVIDYHGVLVRILDPLRLVSPVEARRMEEVVRVATSEK